MQATRDDLVTLVLMTPETFTVVEHRCGGAVAGIAYIKWNGVRVEVATRIVHWRLIAVSVFVCATVSGVSRCVTRLSLPLLPSLRSPAHIRRVRKPARTLDGVASV